MNAALKIETTKFDIWHHGRSVAVRLPVHIANAFKAKCASLEYTHSKAAGEAQRQHNGALAEAIIKWVGDVPLHTTREAWLDAIVDAMRAEFASRGYPLPEKIQVTMGFPSTGWRGKRRGECWASKAHAKGWVQIFIHPCEKDVTEIVNILTHELCHAADEQRHIDAGKPVEKYKGGHGKTFAQIGAAMDMEGKPKEMLGGDAWKLWAMPIIEAAGAMPYDALGAYVAKEKKQTTRMIKCECPECGAIWRTSRKVLEGVQDKFLNGSAAVRVVTPSLQCIDPLCHGRINLDDLLAELEDESEGGGLIDIDKEWGR